MFESLGPFADWLSATPLSQVIQNSSWIIQTMQSLHLLAIAVVMASAVVISLRVLGLVMRDLPLAEVTRRFQPWIWCALIILLLSGTILIIGEPGRSITNIVFQLKMLLLVIAIVCTVLLQRPLRRNESYWDNSTNRRVTSRAIAVFSMAVWCCIVFAGRWIAYTG